MKVIKINFSDIKDFLKDKIISILGNHEDIYVDNLADVEHTNIHTLDWVSPEKINKQDIAEQSKAKVLLVDKEIRPIAGKTLIVVENPKVCLAEIGNRFFMPKPQVEIHPTAIISPNAKIGEDCYVGPYCVIGNNVVIGNGCMLDTYVRVHDDVTIGDFCSVKAGAVLGGEGFGFVKDNNGNRFRFPQIGNLHIGNHVEIGANTCIDRGSLSDTIIGDYTKINNLCHIAHNNKIGKNVEIRGCVNVSGGNVIDDDVLIAPNVTLKGYIHIGKSAFIGMGAVVTKDVPADETWVGNPAHKHEKCKR